MYLHLGADISVNDKYIVAVCDLETTSVSKITQEYLKYAQKADEVINVSEYDLPKSYVITYENKKRKVYISPISSATLLKRSEFLNENKYGRNGLADE